MSSTKRELNVKRHMDRFKDRIRDAYTYFDLLVWHTQDVCLAHYMNLSDRFIVSGICPTLSGNCIHK